MQPCANGTNGFRVPTPVGSCHPVQHPSTLIYPSFSALVNQPAPSHPFPILLWEMTLSDVIWCVYSLAVVNERPHSLCLSHPPCPGVSRYGWHAGAKVKGL